MNRIRYYNQYNLTDFDLRKTYKFHPDLLKYCNLDITKKYKLKNIFDNIKDKITKQKQNNIKFYKITPEFRNILIKINSQYKTISKFSSYYKHNIDTFLVNCIVNHIPDNIYTLDFYEKGNVITEITI